MSINLTDEIEVKTKKGKLGAAKQIFLEGDTQTVEKEIQDINSRHDDLSSKHESLSSTVSEHTKQIESNQSQITANKSAQDEKNTSLDANMAKLNTRDDQITELVKGVTATGGASVATAVTYDNTSSQLASATVQGAVDELQDSKIDKVSIVQNLGEDESKVVSQKCLKTVIDEVSKTVDEVIIEDREISLQKEKIVTLKYKEDILEKYINKDSLYMSILSSDDTIDILVSVYDTNEVPLKFTVNSKNNFCLLIPLEKKYKKYSIYATTKSEETKNVVISVIFGFNTYNSKNADAVSKNVDTIVRSCRYRGNITVEDKTVKFGVGYIYLYTTKGKYSVKITEEKVFENIAQNNMFIVVDTANNNEITTRNEGSNSDNMLNRITDIPLLYWDSNIVYGCLANYLISKNVDAVSKNVDTVLKNVDTIATVRNKTITVEKGKTATIAYKSVIPSSYIEDDILYITLITDTKAITASFTLYEKDETMTSKYYISLDKTNIIAIPLEGKYKKYSIYINTNSEEQIVTSIKVMLGRNSYMISSIDDKVNTAIDSIEENGFVSLPSNIKEEIGTTFKRFSSWNAGKDKIAFPVFTDIHAGKNFDKIKQLKNLIDNFNQFGFDFYANLGDVGIDVAYTNGGLDASYKLLNYISDVSNTANAPVLFANGNHETIVKELPTRVRKEYLNKPQERKWKGLKYVDGGNNGTYTNEEKKLKVIILDNYPKGDNDNPSYLTYEGIDEAQLSWFIEELVKAKDIETIIVLEHSFPYYKGNWRSKKEIGGEVTYEDPPANDNYKPSRASIRNAIIAFNKRQKGEDLIYNNVSYDFSEATGTICGLFSGHSHFDVHHQEEGLLLVCHQSMGDLNLETEMPSWGIYSGFNKLENTLMDIVSICPSARQIKIFRVGAGGEKRDREFSY